MHPAAAVLVIAVVALSAILANNWAERTARRDPAPGETPGGHA